MGRLSRVGGRRAPHVASGLAGDLGAHDGAGQGVCRGVPKRASGENASRTRFLRKMRHAAVVAASVVALAFALSMCACAGTGTSTPSGGESVRLQVFAANSLTEAMDEAAAAYCETHPWVTFADSQYLSSGNLNAQLYAGSYADVLISASSDMMDVAQENGLVEPDSRVNLFTNDLVVVRRKGSDIAISSLEDVVSGSYTVAIGDESVPAGNYACQALYSVGAYTSETGRGGFFVGISPYLDSSVGNVCWHVAAGDVDLGIVYGSDAYRFDEVEIIYEIPENLTQKIVYPAAVCSISDKPDAAAEFIEWCQTSLTARSIWQKWGFIVI